MTPRPRAIVGFVARMLLLYVLLVLPWPGLREGYGWLYRQALAGVTPVAGLAFDANVERYQGSDERLDVKIVGVVPGTRRTRVTILSSRYYDFMANALLLSLVIATPARLRLRLLGVALTLATLWAWMVVRWVSGLNLLLPDLLEPAERALFGVIWGVPWYIAPVGIWAGFGAAVFASERAEPPRVEANA